MIAHNHSNTHHNLQAIYDITNNIANTVLNIEKKLHEVFEAFTVAKASIEKSLKDMRALTKRLHTLTTIIEVKIDHVHGEKHGGIDPRETAEWRGPTQKLLDWDETDD